VGQEVSAVVVVVIVIVWGVMTLTTFTRTLVFI
jgi:hypothetical protein